MSVSTETCAALRSAIIDQVTKDPEPELAALDDVIRRLTSEGHDQHLRVEQLLLVLKSCWHDLPLAIRRLPRAHPDVLLDRMVQGCIRSYYANARVPRRSGRISRT